MASAPGAPPGADPPAFPDVFEIRLNTIDYYMVKPVPGLDETVSPFRGDAPVDQVRDTLGMLAPRAACFRLFFLSGYETRADD